MPMIHQQLRSALPNTPPLPSALLVGQLAINFPDRKIYTLDNFSNVVQLGVAPSDLSSVAITGSWNDLLDKPNISSEYVLPPGSPTVLGGVKPQGGLSVDGAGVLTANVLSVQGRTGAVVITSSDLGIVDLLGVDGKVQDQYLPDSLLGAVTYQGTWNASTNTPTIPAPATGNKGWYYVVNVAGTTTIGSNSTWAVGDWIISDGTQWSRINFGASAVLTVNGNVGDVIVNAANLPGLSLVGKTNLYTDLSSIPTSFPPSTHTHTVSQITDIALVAKTNSYTDLSNLPPDVTISTLAVNAQGAPALIYDVSYVFSRSAQYAGGWGTSAAAVTLVSGTTATISIRKNGTQVGQIAIASSGASITFSSTFGPTLTFAHGDVLTYAWLTSNIASASITLQGHWI